MSRAISTTKACGSSDAAVGAGQQAFGPDPKPTRRTALGRPNHARRRPHPLPRPCESTCANPPTQRSKASSRSIAVAGGEEARGELAGAWIRLCWPMLGTSTPASESNAPTTARSRLLMSARLPPLWSSVPTHAAIRSMGARSINQPHCTLTT